MIKMRNGKSLWLGTGLATILFAFSSFAASPLVSAKATSLTLRTVQGRTDDVKFDNYTLLLKGQRVFLSSGEFHTFRLPVPSLWPDILQKVKAAGLNAISVYTHMGLINPAPGVVDFGEFRALQPLFDAAKEVGLWIVLRPGPYINAETTAGGIAHWVISEVAGTLRTNDSEWRAAWQDYIHGIIDVTAPNQISRGGPVIAIQIDNEYQQNPITHAEYFADLEEAFRNSGIIVPLTANDAGEGRNFINGTGAVDLYGIDAYPRHSFDCFDPTVWNPVTTNYHSYHTEVNPSQPWYIPEFQGGAADAWGVIAPGYFSCRTLTGPDFQSVFNLNLWASNAKLINYYMVYGGTSWGAIPFHGVYTSYDYGAAINESRELTAKYDELKRQSLFLRSSPEFYKTDWVADASTGLSVSTNPAAFITLLRNFDTGAQFYIARQTDSVATATTTFKLNVTTSAGPLQIPMMNNIILAGRESKVVITDYTFGSSSKALYSTAQVFFAGNIDGRDILLLYGNPNQTHEVAINLTGTPNNLVPTQSPWVQSNQSQIASTTVFAILPGARDLITLYDSDTQLILFADSTTAATFWAPVIPGETDDPFRNYWSIGSNQTVLVGGPYLVRNATLDSTGQHLSLTGDLKESVRLTIIAQKAVKTVSWNGDLVRPDASIAPPSAIGTFVGRLVPSEVLRQVKVPNLTGWKFKDSLPEVNDPMFDDASWALANKTSTNIPFKPNYGDGRILYGCDYGFCESIVLWRGHFQSTGQEKSMNLSINGGEAFAASVWLNDVFLNTSFGDRKIEELDQKFFIPPNVLKFGDNVVTVVQDNMGFNESGATNPNGSRNPRGIRGFSLEGGTFGDWKVQGKVGGYQNYPDKVRGVLNEGGLFGERKGWHLPGFPPVGWEHRDLSKGLPGNKAGVGFFITTFDLNIPRGIDAMLSFSFEEPFGRPYRAYLFVNGWTMGKRVGNLGPQSKFPVHEGILNYRGSNTVAVALWTMTPNVPIAPDLRLTIDAVYEGGIGNVQMNNPKWSTEGRE